MRVGLVSSALLLGAVLPVSVPTSAETLGDARVGFSADRILILDGRSYVGRMWHMPGEQRHEQEFPAVRSVFILHAGSSVSDVVLPQLHTVVQFALPKEFSLLANLGLVRESVGQEAVDGVQTTKYAVDENTSGGRATGALWLSEEGVPMKCDAEFTARNGKISTIHWELRHLKLGAQDPGLFEVPQGYVKLSAEAAAPLLGIRLARPPSH